MKKLKNSSTYIEIFNEPKFRFVISPNVFDVEKNFDDYFQSYFINKMMKNYFLNKIKQNNKIINIFILK